MSVELFVNLMIQECEQGVAENGGFDAGGWGDCADAVAGKMVWFYLPDVLQELREKAKTSKRNVARRL